MAPTAISSAERSRYFHELAAMADAGVDHARAFKTLGQSRGRAARGFRQAANAVAHGRDLAEAGAAAGVFTALDARLVASASRSGTLVAAYHRLAEWHGAFAVRAARLKAQCVLPAFVFSLALFLVPLPGLASGQISLGDYVGNVLTLLIIAVVSVVLVLATLRHLERAPRSAFAVAISRVTLMLPLLGPNNRRRNVARFLDACSVYLEAGMPAAEAVREAVLGVRNQRIAAALRPVSKTLVAGRSVVEAFAISEVVGLDVLGALKAGESAGRLDDVMRRTSFTELQEAFAFDDQVAAWAPKLLYLIVLGWIARNVLGSGALAS